MMTRSERRPSARVLDLARVRPALWAPCVCCFVFVCECVLRRRSRVVNVWEELLTRSATLCGEKRESYTNGGEVR